MYRGFLLRKNWRNYVEFFFPGRFRVGIFWVDFSVFPIYTI